MSRGASERNFRKIKNQIPQIQNIIRHTKVSALWEHEAALRKKIKSLKELKSHNLRDYNRVLDQYLDMLEYVSEKLMKEYNNKNFSDYNFKDIIKAHYDSYLKSGIISVLITQHIPEIALKEFERVFPSNPKNEYAETRKMKRKFYLHLGETNTGKTYNAIQRLKASSKGVYLSPLRILALENFERLNKEGVRCDLLTGEEEVRVNGANHISCTIEKLDITEEYDVGIIDEIQMIQDDQRGAAWTRAMLGLKSSEIHVCGALNSKEILIEILEDCGEQYEIREYKRDIPLEMVYDPFTYRRVETGDALVVFSKKRVLELAYYYSELGIKASLIYGDLPPEVRKKQYELFINKETSILISTDAIGMGVNLPIRRIVFMDIKKFDGYEYRYLNSQEVKQIAGRAGRKGIYEVGYVAGSGMSQDFLYENLHTEDDLIERAVVGPTEEILKIKSLPLREKLALWITQDEKLPYYRKMNIEEYLILLDRIKHYKLKEEIQWRLLKIPFDVSNEDIMNTFLLYVDQIFIAKWDMISKPERIARDLKELENYYQKVNLYYSFSKVFSLDFDEAWVYAERLRVSDQIIDILRKI